MTEHEQDLWTQELDAELPSNREVAGFWFGFLVSTFVVWTLLVIMLVAAVQVWPW